MALMPGVLSPCVSLLRPHPSFSPHPQIKCVLCVCLLAASPSRSLARLINNVGDNLSPFPKVTHVSGLKPAFNKSLLLLMLLHVC